MEREDYSNRRKKRKHEQMKQKLTVIKGSAKRILAVALSLVLVNSVVDYSGIMTASAQTNTKEMTITAFDKLSDSVKEQTLPLGAVESDITFPETLKVTVETKTEEAATEEATTEESTTEDTTETSTVEKESEEAATQASTEEKKEESTTPAETTPTETSQSDVTEPENDSEPQNEPSGQDLKTDDEDTEVEGSGKGNEEARANIFTSIWNAVDTTFSMGTVYAAESETSEAEIEVTWKLDTESSAYSEFKGGIAPKDYFTSFDKDGEAIETEEETWEGYYEANQDVSGAYYVYTPVLPEKDADGNTLMLADDVELPEIFVVVGASDIMLMADEENVVAVVEIGWFYNGNYYKKSFSSLEEAISYIDEETFANSPDVTLLQNVTYQGKEDWIINKEIWLYLGGYELDMQAYGIQFKESGNCIYACDKGEADDASKQTGSIISTGTAVKVTGGGLTVYAATITGSSSAIEKTDGKLQLRGGTFKNSQNDGVVLKDSTSGSLKDWLNNEYAFYDTTSEKKRIEITDDTKEIKQAVTVDIAKNVELTQGDAEPRYFGGVNSALQAITDKNSMATVKLLDNVDGDIYGFSGKKITLDLNGKKLKTSLGIDISYDIPQNLTFTDSSNEKTGEAGYLEIGNLSTTDNVIRVQGGIFTKLVVSRTSKDSVQLTGGTFKEGIAIDFEKSGQIKTLSDLLPEGYCFYKGDAATGKGADVFSGDVVKTTDTVTVGQVPVKITIQPTAPAALKYGETATLTVGTDVTEGVSYQWYLDNSENAIEGEVSASCTTSDTLSVGEHTYVCKVTKDGYTVSTNPVTITVGQADGTVSELTITGWIYGSYSADTNKPSSTSITNTGVTPVYEYKLTAKEDATYSETVPTDAGNYTLRVTYPETTNYKAATNTFNFTIEPKTLTTDMFESIDGQYFTGSQITPSVSAASSSGLTTSDYEVKKNGYGTNNTVGEATGSVTVSGKGNYTGNVTLNFAIKYYDGLPYVLYNGTTKADYYNQAVAITTEGYTISDSPTGTFAYSYSLDGEDGTVSEQLYFKQDGTGYITDAKPVSVEMDKTAPTFTGDSDGIQITSHDAWWQTLLKVITFGMYKTQNGTIHATDAKSGIETYKYFIDTNPGTTALTADKLDALDGSKWTSTTGLFSMDTEGKYVVYAYAVDKVGNRSAYICTDGIVIDNTVPTVTVAVPEETKKDVTATLHITSTETGSLTYLISETDATYISLEGVFGIQTDSITEEQVTSGADITLTKLSPSKTYYVYVAVTDAAGNTSTVAKISFTTNKTQPIFVTAPTLTGTYGDTVSELKINGTVVTGNGVDATSDNNIAGHWTITEANATTIIPTVGSTTAYEITFTPTDTTQYAVITKNVVPTVAKATPVVNVLPTAATITYGQTLGDSNLTGGTAKYSSSNNAVVDGVYTWTTGTIKPAVSDSGVTEYSVTFTPSETANYNSFTAQVTLTVNKATNAPNMPGTTMAPKHSLATVGDVTLPTDWIWNTEDAAQTLSDGVAVTATATYNGTDKGNYENESVEITLTRAACDHTNTEIRNAKAATCKAEGYTGDTYCSDCGTLISSGTAIPALGHTGGTATCKEQAVCDICHEHYGVLDPSNHTHTEIRNKLDATCTAEGYTGDKYCSDCGTKLSSGTTIAALGHNYVGKITKQPTTTEEGVMTYTCTRCGASYTRPIAKLPAESDDETDTNKPQIEGDDGKKGWDVIIGEIDNAKDGDTVVVDMNGITVVPGNVIDRIKDKDITIVLDMEEGIHWTINGNSVTGENFSDIDLDVTKNADKIPVDIVNQVTGENYSMQIELSHNGEFGFTATLIINLEKENAGYYANLFYFNEDTEALEFMGTAQIDEDGNAALDFVHASAYTIVVSAEPMSAEDVAETDTDGSKDTSDTEVTGTTVEATDETSGSMMAPWIIFGIVVVVAIGGGLYLMKRKKETEE